MVAVVVMCLAGPTTVSPAPATTAQANYPAKFYMDAYMGYWASQGHRGEAQLCLSALYATYYYAEFVWGPSVGVPAGAGAALFGVYFNGPLGGRCPGLGWAGGSSYSYGISCMGSTGVSCPEGAGPYVSARFIPPGTTSQSPKNIGLGAEGQSSVSLMYYVWAHESGHQWAFRTGAADPQDECYADDFAVAMGARDFFGRCA
ncbi:MAG: hypothetical protein QOG43_431 [Actinomycetota bacterium]|jgi:hypothetical protein|nr:hypothetical protein [Actinomycetota bacterium]